MVHLKIDPSVRDGRFHPRFNGQTGEVVGQQGAAYKVRIDDRGKEKTLLATPAHLRSQAGPSSRSSATSSCRGCRPPPPPRRSS